VFRQIDVGGSVRFGFSIVLQYLHFWLLVGAAWSWLAPTLHHLFWDGKPTFLGSAVLFFLVGLWPLAVSARASLESLEGRTAGIGTLFEFGAIFHLLLPVGMILVLSGASGLVVDWVFTKLLGKGLVPFTSTLQDPLTATQILKFYPLACLGSITVAMPLSFCPWVAADKGVGFSDSIEWAGRLSRDVKMEILFLQSTMFFTTTITFILGFLLRGPSFPQNIGAYVVYAMAFAFVGGAWMDAYRQALLYEEPPTVKKSAPKTFSYNLD
jgi:hypothetical protein